MVLVRTAMINGKPARHTPMDCICDGEGSDCAACIVSLTMALHLGSGDLTIDKLKRRSLPSKMSGKMAAVCIEFARRIETRRY